MTRAGTIPLADIVWIRIYENRRHLSEQKLPQMLRESGGDLIFNGPIFLRSGKACCHLKADGKVLCRPNYTAWCAAWNNPPADFGVETAPNDKKNYVETCHILIGGKKVEKINCGKDMRYACNRTVIGTKQGRFAYLVTETNYTPEGLRDYLFSIGWDNAILLDGGGSSCIWFSDGTGFIGSDPKRVIPFYIAIKLKPAKDTEPKGEKPMVTINAYSKKRDRNKRLSGNFTVGEFACSDGTDTVFVAPRLVMVLQSIRSHFGKPVTLHSAYRTPNKNTAVGGVEDSQHLYGTAADISIKGVEPAAVAAYAESIMPDWGGIGIYDNNKSGHFTHIDVREVKARWKG